MSNSIREPIREPVAIGTRRVVSRFAWLPIRLDSGRWTHLAWYDVVQEYRAASDDLEPWGSLQPEWKRIRRY